ncbi:competence protein ComK [Lysinibacillus telephonicus]|uniref:competence protein ComK n=1 Tax=Lysinibacillus telephonicus TaxID=1714840 RepID=UPI0031FD4BB7
MCFEEMKILKEHACHAIAPYYNGMHSSIIYTDQGHVFSKEPVQKIIENLCLEYGSTLLGRLHASREMLGYIKNPPILISESLPRVAIQAPCYYTKETIWILDLNFKIKKCNSFSEIIFNPHVKLPIDLSLEAIRQRKLKGFELLVKFML